MNTIASFNAVLLAAINLALISILPWTYFRGGACHPRWWLTTLPFVVADAALLAGLLGFIQPWSAAASSWIWSAASIFVCAGSMVLLGATLTAHDHRPVKYHQVEDIPRALVTRGPYSRIRHPFYLSYVLGLFGCALALPHPATAVAFLIGTVEMWRTAAREERRLLAGPFAVEYVQYRRRTGRFLPRL